jgi:hypothetical protein
MTRRVHISSAEQTTCPLCALLCALLRSGEAHGQVSQFALERESRRYPKAFSVWSSAITLTVRKDRLEKSWKFQSHLHRTHLCNLGAVLDSPSCTDAMRICSP